MKSKKSQSMPVNVIVVAAICLIILVVLVVIFTRTSGTAVNNLGSCLTKGGHCTQPNGCTEAGYSIELYVSGDCKNSDAKYNGLCCLKSDFK